MAIRERRFAREVLLFVAAALVQVGGPAIAATHVSRTMVKLGARDRAQLVVYGYETGLVTSGWTE